MIRAEALARGRLFTYCLILFAALLTVAAMVRDAAATGSPEPVPAETMLTQGGLFLPSERPGYVIPATGVDSDVAIEISGLVARARITQSFENPTAHWVEGVYVFPLPENAAVDRLEMRIGDRIVQGEIQEKEAAQRIYRQAAAAGQRASLVSQERPNIFTTAVANIAPNDSLVVTIEYQQSLAYDAAAGLFSMRFPMVVLPRYIPGTPIAATEADLEGTGWAVDTDRVPDASRITPPVAAPGTGPVNPVTLTVRLDPGFPVEAIESPYHGIAVEDHDDGRFTITLAEGAVWADRDFELTWRPVATAAPTLGVFRETVADAEYYLLLVMPPIAEDAAIAAEDRPREIVFVIDTSGSMAGDSILQARQALLDGLARLGPSDRFNIIEFNNQPNALFSSAKPAVEGTLRRARNFVGGLVADGGTEMRQALEMALDGTAEEGTIRQVVFITDGSVGNEAELFTVIHRLLGSTRLFTVGIGSAPNSHFMREAAEIGRGTFTYIGATREVGETMAALFDKLDRPALTGIAVTWPSGDTPEAYPATVPDLYVGEPVLVSVRLPLDTEGDVAVTGSAAGAPWQRLATLETGRDAPGVAALWARGKIAELERDRYRGADPGATRDQILEVALAHQLVSQYTSLVAVDEEVVRPPEEDLTTEAVATNMPHGVDMQMAGPRPQQSDPAPLQDASLSGPHPDSVAAIRSMAETGSPIHVAQLPGTATSAAANIAFGAILLLAAALLLWVAGQRRLVA